MTKLQTLVFSLITFLFINVLGVNTVQAGAPIPVNATSTSFATATTSAPVTKQKQTARKPLRKHVDTVVAAIVGFFIPCLGLYLYEGSITKRFWIALVLQLLVFTWLIASIYALVVILGGK